MSLVRAHIFVSGRVQGVFFRAETQRKARKFGVSGFVRNLNDGRVEIVAQGEKEEVEKLINWAEKGPFFAKVKNMQVRWEDCREQFQGFEIRY